MDQPGRKDAQIALALDYHTNVELYPAWQRWLRDHQPLAAVLGAFADAGFKVDRVAEPQPSPEALRLFPDDLGAIVGVPSFIVYSLWLQP